MLNKLQQLLILPFVNLFYIIISLLRTITIIQTVTLAVLACILLAMLIL